MTPPELDQENEKHTFPGLEGKVVLCKSAVGLGLN